MIPATPSSTSLSASAWVSWVDLAGQARTRIEARVAASTVASVVCMVVVLIDVIHGWSDLGALPVSVIKPTGTVGSRSWNRSNDPGSKLCTHTRWLAMKSWPASARATWAS
jgi:hypothetical protein